MQTSGLDRFLEAQDYNYKAALQEIKNGRKRTHWIWFIFPQIKGLGISDISKQYAIQSMAEAQAYLLHDILGPRLVEISNALLLLNTGDAHTVFGSPDDMKLRSSMTLFAATPGAPPVFEKVLQKFFNGIKDEKTLAILAESLP